MNKIFLQLFIFMNILSAEDPLPCPIEMYVLVENETINTTITFQSLGPTWDESHDIIQQNMSFSLTFTANATIPYMGCDRIGNETGESCITSSHPYGYSIFPYGKFYVSSSEDWGGFSEYSFILNIVDSDYPYNRSVGTNYGPTNDFSIKDDGGSRFYWEEAGQTAPENVTNQIISGSEITIWQLCGKYVQSPNQVRFQPTIPTGLSYSSTNNHPDIRWRRSEPYNGNVT